MSLGRENGTMILYAMAVAVINENCCYRDPLGVFRTVSVEWDVSWKSISYGEILIVVCDGWRVRLPRRSELEDDVRSLELPRRSVRHVVEGHVVQFDPQALKMGTDPEAEGPNGLVSKFMMSLCVPTQVPPWCHFLSPHLFVLS